MCSIFFIVVYILVWTDAVKGGNCTLSKEENLVIERQLKLLNKPYVKSFKTKHGEIFDCVDVHKQPALDHPLLKNHTVQMRPSFFPSKSNLSEQSPSNFSKSTFKEMCPRGTVLIRRTLKEDLICIRDGEDPPVENHYAGIWFTDMKGYKYGAQALMDVHDVPNVSGNQGSAVQVILSKGERNSNDFNAIHFGWIADGYQQTGCANLLCPGFVVAGSSLTPGMVIPTGKGSLKLSGYKDLETGNWWIAAGHDEQPIGYWPKELLPNMEDLSAVRMCGLVYSPPSEPSPPMCNGIKPRRNDPKDACQFKQIRLRDGKGSFEDPDNYQNWKDISDIEDYYAMSTFKYDGAGNGFVFSFGGPGGYKH